MSEELLDDAHVRPSGEQVGGEGVAEGVRAHPPLQRELEHGPVQMARDAGLDFIFLTDHNTTAGLADIDASTTEELLTAGGVEMTTFWGHALCMGTRAWVDWRFRPGGGDMPRIAAGAKCRFASKSIERCY